METLTQARKELKKIGFKIKTETLSWGKHASYEDNLGERMPSIFDKQSLSYWQPLIDWRNNSKDELKSIAKAEGIIGL